MQISRPEVITSHFHHSQQLCYILLGFLLRISLSLHEPLIEMIADLEEHDDSYQQKDEEVIQDQLRVILQWFEAIYAEIGEVCDDKQYIR